MKPRKLLPLLALLLLLGLFHHASLPRPTGPAEGTAIQGTATHLHADSATFRIGTFNVHGCKGADGCRDVDRVARCLEGLDFVALNEVHGPWFWQRTDQAADLGHRLGLAWLFAPGTRSWYHYEFGNGFLSGLPVASWKRIPLEHVTDRGYRNAVLVDVRHAGRTIHLVVSHLTRHDDASRQKQLRQVIDLFLSLPEPAVLLGDLNSTAEDARIRQLLAVRGVTDPLGAVSGTKPAGRIDWIFARGLRTVDAGMRDEGASDHPLVWAELCASRPAKGP
jgi:endonuclease/exonuclease/phosphatase family metal-dependent hydrolase